MRQLEYTKSNTAKNLSYLLIGGGIGATLALLFAPKSGSELRGDISSAATNGYEKARETVGQIRDNAGDYYENVKDKANQLYNSSAETVENVAQDVKELPKQAENLVQKTVDKAETAFEAGKQEMKKL